MKQLTIRLPGTLKTALTREARQRGYTAKDLVLFILQNQFESMPQE